MVEVPAHAKRPVARFRSVRHSTQSFIASVYLGAIAPVDDVALAQMPAAGTIAMYGHGSSRGEQAALDAALEGFDVDIDLKPALCAAGYTSGPVVLSIVVRDLEDKVRPAAWLRFADVVVTDFP